MDGPQERTAMNPKARIVCGVGAALVVTGIGSLHYVYIQLRKPDTSAMSWTGVDESAVRKRLDDRMAETGKQLSEAEQQRVIDTVQSKLGTPLKQVYVFGWAACAIGCGLMVSSWAWPRPQEPRR